MSRTRVFLSFLSGAVILSAITPPAFAIEYMTDHIPAAEKVGKGRLTYLFWDVYDATLYAPQGTWKEDKPFALELSYLRDIPGKSIADRSIEEIRLQGYSDEIKLAAWYTQMRSIFPDVNEGITLTGIFTNSGETIFFKNSKEIGRIQDSEFSQAFFNIWLSEKTSSPTLRDKLLGSL